MTTSIDLVEYVERIAELRRRAGDAQRDAYTAALGQLYAVGLIDEAVWRGALDRPRHPDRSAGLVYDERRERALAYENDAEALKGECDSYGLPLSLRALLRHLYGNVAATLGAKDYSIAFLEAKLRSIPTADARSRGCDEEYPEGSGPYGF